MKEKEFDWTQFSILIVAVFCMFGGFGAWMIENFASAKDVSSLDARVQKVEQLPTDVAVIKEEVHEIKRTLDRHWK